MKFFVAAAAAAAALVLGGSARVSAGPTVAVGGQMAFGAQAQPGPSLSTVSPLLGLRLDPKADGGHGVWELWWGAAASGSFGADLRDLVVRAGNPWLSARLGGGGPALSWRMGAGATFPLARVALSDEGRLGFATYNHAMGMRGVWDLWLWAPDTLAVPLTGEVSRGLGDAVTVGGHAAVAALFAMSDRPGEGGEVVVQTAATACARGDEAVVASVCGWSQIVWVPRSTLDRTQVAIGARVTAAEAFRRVYVAALVNLDEPLGLDRGTRTWGLFLGREVSP